MAPAVSMAATDAATAGATLCNLISASPSVHSSGRHLFVAVGSPIPCLRGASVAVQRRFDPRALLGAQRGAKDGAAVALELGGHEIRVDGAQQGEDGRVAGLNHRAHALDEVFG